MPAYNPGGRSPIREDRLLTNFSIEVGNGDFVGNVLFPRVTVRNKSDLYRIHDPDKKQWGPTMSSVRAPGAPVREVPGLTTATATYRTQEHALQVYVDDEELENIPAGETLLQPIADATRYVTGLLMLERELEIVDRATTAANYPGSLSTTLVGNAQWDEYSTSDPIGVMRVASRAIHAQLRTKTNTAIVPWLVMSWLTDHPDFIERIRYVREGTLTQEIVASMLDLGNVIVPEVGYNSAELGLDPSISYIWGDDVILAYVPPNVRQRMIAYGLDIVQTFPSGQVMSTDRRRDENRIGQIIRVRQRRDLVMPTLDGDGKNIAGYLIKDTLG